MHQEKVILLVFSPPHPPLLPTWILIVSGFEQMRSSNDHISAFNPSKQEWKYNSVHEYQKYFSSSSVVDVPDLTQFLERKI